MKVTEGIGHRIKSIRNSKYLTQKELAALLNISEVHVKQIEQGRRSPSLDVLVDMVNILEVSSDTLLFGHVKVTSDREEIAELVRIFTTLPPASNKVLLNLARQLLTLNQFYNKEEN